MTRTFADVATGKRRSRGCPRCGAEKNVGQILLALNRLAPNGREAGRITSTSTSLCESCGVEMYEMLDTVLRKETNRP